MVFDSVDREAKLFVIVVLHEVSLIGVFVKILTFIGSDLNQFKSFAGGKIFFHDRVVDEIAELGFHDRFALLFAEKRGGYDDIRCVIYSDNFAKLEIGY